MHKYRDQIKKGVVVTILALLSMPSALLGQARTDSPRHLLEIQRSFAEGEMDVETAALEQFRVLYEFPGNSLHKCATPAEMFLHAHRDRISPDALAKIESIRSGHSPSKKKQALETYISPSGKFEIVYVTSGDDSVSVEDNDGNGVPDYVDLVAESADSSYRHEVINLGFKDPIPTGTTYTIELEDLSYYGETIFQGGSGPETYIVMENDFVNFPPNTHPLGNQVGAVYATVAHELKHAIQYAQNEWASPSGAFDWAEMDATLFEEVVYDDVNDYYNYIKNGLNSSDPYSASIFFAPEDGTPGAYWHVSWMIFYSEYFGDELWSDVWQMIEGQNNLSIDEVLVDLLPDRGEDFETSFVRNHLWHFASGSRAGQDNYGFGEKLQYPNANLEAKFNSVPEEAVEVNFIRPLAARYFEIEPSAGDDGFIEVAVDFDSTQVGLGVLLYMNNGEMNELIATGENKSQVYVPTEVTWQEVEKIGVVIANYSNSGSTREIQLLIGKEGNTITIRDPEYADLPKSVKIYQNYPNPFNPETNINFDLPRSAFVELTVYDITGRKVQTLTAQDYRLGSYSIPFNAQGLSSGVYFYRLKINDEVFTKKMTLLK
ncbi:T9SS type A sorting domain-containing protein [Gracilimonas sediminicola]|uniref:T9SS type A sorting domain-containing protein n=1 Tax=Gracilimonas sediminicola TaxID=2952158 RepID=A0A9X2RGQ9_9BACT|nr:T9SS type A sorting domain-containing protein [Gracilimonas sediminicola]MCP9291119.1 T9SS type A sorting domain-containing protein [Gracilimonas sediminicola]